MIRIFLQSGKNRSVIVIFFLITLYGISSCLKQETKNQNGFSMILELADSLRYSDPARADSLYNVVISARPSSQNSTLLTALTGLATVYTDQGQYDSARRLLDMSREILPGITDTLSILMYYLSEGYYFTELERYAESEKSYLAGYQISEKNNNQKYRHIFHLNLGQVLIEQGKYAEATKVLNDEMDYSIKGDQESHVAVCLKNLATISYLTKDYEKALSVGKVAAAIYKKLNMTSEYASQLLNIGIYYRGLERFDSAQEVYRLANQLMTNYGDTLGTIKIKYNLANIFILRKMYSDAEKEMMQVYQYCKRHNIATGQVYALSALSDIYFQTGKKEEALTALDTALALAHQHNLITDLRDFYDSRRLKLAQMDRYKESYESLVKARMFSDSLLSVEKQKEILELQTRYETVRKEAENLLLKKDIQVKQTRLWLLGIVVVAGALLAAVIISLLIMRHRRISHSQQITLERNQRLELESRLKDEQISKLHLETELKEQELVFQSMVRAEFSHLLAKVRDQLSPFALRLPRKKDQDDFHMILRELSRSSKKDPLSEFEILFKQLYPGFYEKLLSVNETFSKSELLVSAMIRLNLSSKDIMKLMNLSLNTVDSIRSRVRKKLDLDQKDNLTTFLIGL